VKVFKRQACLAINAICWTHRQYTLTAIEGVSFIITLSTIDVIGRPGGCSLYTRLCCLFPRHDKM